jgi:hypothetical protein
VKGLGQEPKIENEIEIDASDSPLGVPAFPPCLCVMCIMPFIGYVFESVILCVFV